MAGESVLSPEGQEIVRVANEKALALARALRAAAKPESGSKSTYDTIKDRGRDLDKLIKEAGG